MQRETCQQPSGPMKKGANENREPLAPFNQAEPFELAALAVLLSKGEDPAEHLQAAASLWAEAYQYREDLRHLYWGQEYKAIAKFTPPVRSVGMSEEFMDVKTACAKYSWGQRHLRDLIKADVPPNTFRRIWKTPITSIRIPKTLLERLEKSQAEKRVARARKAVKPTKGV